MKILAKIFLVLITFFTLMLSTTSLAVTSPTEPANETGKAHDTSNTKDVSSVSDINSEINEIDALAEASETVDSVVEFTWLDIETSPRWWGMKIFFGKNETKQMTKLITDQNIEGIVSACKVITKDNTCVNKFCAYAVNSMINGLQEGFTQAAHNDNKTCLSISCLRKWIVKEILEK